MVPSPTVSAWRAGVSAPSADLEGCDPGLGISDGLDSVSY